MKIYIASSVKNSKRVLQYTVLLRAAGHQVFNFLEVDATTTDRDRDFPELRHLNALTFLESPNVQRIFFVDRFGIDWADAVLLLLPAGPSAHLEAGYAVGKRKLLYILREEWPTGEFEVMYSFAEGLFTAVEDIISAIGLRERLENQLVAVRG